ncbi:hypothetical protein NMY22_g19917 [Coprinellus aureogranulatus]|nr:hypothetical protein NMY22_g19917 [Coprinellus aureogranulatus]
MDDRLDTSQFSTNSFSAFPPKEPSAPLHVFEELMGAPQSAQSLSSLSAPSTTSSFSVPSTTDNQTVPLRQDINMFADTTGFTQPQTSIPFASASAYSGPLAPGDRSTGVPSLPRPRPVACTRSVPSFESAQDDSLQADVFNLSQRRSTSRAHNYPPFISTPTRTSPPKPSFVTPHSSVQVSPSIPPFMAPSERSNQPHPTYASRFVTSLLAGDNAAKNRSPIPIRADDHGMLPPAQMHSTNQYPLAHPLTNIQNHTSTAKRQAFQSPSPPLPEYRLPENLLIRTRINLLQTTA